MKSRLGDLLVHSILATEADPNLKLHQPELGGSQSRRALGWRAIHKYTAAVGLENETCEAHLQNNMRGQRA